jgi:hypothetical protein
VPNGALLSTGTTKPFYKSTKATKMKGWGWPLRDPVTENAKKKYTTNPPSTFPPLPPSFPPTPRRMGTCRLLIS